MAYDKIITIHSRLDHCVDYALNEEKTGLSYALSYAENPEKSNQLVTGINCQAATAYAEMQATKRRWDKNGGVLGYHIIHSFAPGEVTPEEAHAAGVEFARRLLGDRYEAVVSTHLDRDHLHCHIVLNSVSFVDGKKYRSDFKSYFGDLRETSNAVSREHGLSVIERSGHGKHYAEWNAEKHGRPTIRGQIRQDIDAAIRESFTFEAFLATLRRRGYTVKYGPSIKHTAIRPPGGERFIRLDSLKEGYTEADIRARLTAVRNGDASPQIPVPIPPPKHYYRVRQGSTPRTHRKRRGFRALYAYYLYFLHPKRPPRRRSPPFSVRQEVTKLQRYQRQFRLLLEYRIDSGQQLTMLGEALQAEIDVLTNQRKTLYGRRRNGEDMAADLECINEELRQLRQRLKTCIQIEKDIPHVQAQMEIYRNWKKQESVREQRTRDAMEKTRTKHMR